MGCKLKVEDLELQVYLGWTEHERKKTQPVILSIEFIFDQLPAAVFSDNLQDTICYAEIEQMLRKKIAHQKFNLIEYLGQECYTLIQSMLPPSLSFKISLTKFLGVPHGTRTFEL